MDYAEQILGALLDTYERSALSRGENKRTIHITYEITKEHLPAYFDESTLEYERIHACLLELEGRGYLTIQWRHGVVGHIAERVTLREDHVDEVYKALHRTPARVHLDQTKELLLGLKEECATPVAAAFTSWLLERLEQNKPVREYIDIASPKETERLVRAVCAVESNREGCYLREFSIRCFADSKTFEGIKGSVKKVFSRFREGWEDAEEKEIFAEYGIYDTPDYVYLKGEGELLLETAAAGTKQEDVAYLKAAAVAMGQDGGEASGRIASQERQEARELPLYGFRQGIGITGEDLGTIRVRGTARTRRVITIENLTTFFRWQEEDALIIYLGGYHNHTRRRLLGQLHEALPHAQYLHFGDIDVGGFEIYLDLCRKTQIPFAPYHMGIRELEENTACVKELTVNDRKSMQRLLEKADAACPPSALPWLPRIRETLTYMLSHNVKLEQECIRPEGYTDKLMNRQ